MQVDVKLDGDELTRLQAALKEHQAEHSRLLREVRQQNEFIMQQIRVDRDIRLQLLPHLEAMINLLRLGRRIANTRLDRSLTKTVTVDRLDVRLPEELSRKIGVFAQAIRENISVSPQMMQDMATSVATISQAKSALDSGMHGPTGEVVASPMPESNLSEQDLVQLTAAGNQTLQAATGFLEAAARLEAMKVQQTIADQKYRQELAALQNRFRDYMKQIDNRSAALMKALRQLNTAQDHEQLKQGLLALVGDNNDLIRKEDLDELIHGTKTIEL